MFQNDSKNGRKSQKFRHFDRRLGLSTFQHVPKMYQNVSVFPVHFHKNVLKYETVTGTHGLIIHFLKYYLYLSLKRPPPSKQFKQYIFKTIHKTENGPNIYL